MGIHTLYGFNLYVGWGHLSWRSIIEAKYIMMCSYVDFIGLMTTHTCSGGWVAGLLMHMGPLQWPCKPPARSKVSLKGPSCNTYINREKKAATLLKGPSCTYIDFNREKKASTLLPRPRRGLRGIVLTRSVCLCVCLSVCVSVCPADILVFYFSAIRRDIDLKFIQDTYRVVLKSLNKIDLHRSKIKVKGTVHCFLKVQSYHKNWAIEKFQFCFIDTS